MLYGLFHPTKLPHIVTFLFVAALMASLITSSGTSGVLTALFSVRAYRFLTGPKHICKPNYLLVYIKM
jgi:hypothetical protein